MEPEKKQFRLNAKNISITVPQCEANKQDVQKALEEKFGGQLSGYVIARETHEDGGHHLHLAVKFKEKKNFKDPKCFNFLTGQQANVQGTKYPKKWVDYCLKEDSEAIVMGDIKEDFTWQEILNSETKQEAWRKLVEMKPRDAAINGQKVLQGWETHQTMAGKKRKYVRRDPPQVHVYFGSTGTGKTYRCEQFAIDNDMSLGLLNMEQLKKGWYTDWANQEIAWLDDFRGGVMQPHEFLNLLDSKMESVPVKGGKALWGPKYIFITSSDHPVNWWPNWYAKDGNNWAQVARRISKIFETKKEGDEYRLREVQEEDPINHRIAPPPQEVFGALGERQVRIS